MGTKGATPDGRLFPNKLASGWLKEIKAWKYFYLEKLETLIDFPLEGLDMSPYVRSESQKA